MTLALNPHALVSIFFEKKKLSQFEVELNAEFPCTFRQALALSGAEL